MNSDRADLLAFLARTGSGRGRFVQVERWRRRGWSGSRIAAETERVAAALYAAGIEPGDRVALQVADGPLWIAAFYGALRAGAAAVPLDASLNPGVLVDFLEGVRASAVITGPEAVPLEGDRRVVPINWRGVDLDSGPAPPWPADEPGRVAEIVLTSGTTGTPTAVPVTHANLRAVLDVLAAEIAERSGPLGWLPPLSVGVALPLSHLYGQLMGVFVPALLGARVHLLAPMPSPDLARRLREEPVIVLATVPRTLDLLARHLRDRGEAMRGEAAFESWLSSSAERRWLFRRLGSMRLRREVGRRLLAVVSGGAALDPGIERFWRAIGIQVLQGYGLTETAPLVTLQNPFDATPGTLGHPLPGVELRIAEDGEILVRGANVVGERLHGRAVDVAGWLHTGDLGRRDAGGRLVFLGRKGERIVNPEGVNIDPGPVVDVLKAHPDVLDALVLERPWGRPGVVCAVVVPRAGGAVSAAIRAANDTLPDAARIRDWRVWPETDFPRTSTGKPRRQEVLDWLEGLAPRPTAEDREADRAATDAVPRDAVTRAAATIADIPSSDLNPSDRVVDVLGSLDRIELATRLETTYGIRMGERAFDEDLTFESLTAKTLGRAESAEPERRPEASEAAISSVPDDANRAPPLAGHPSEPPPTSGRRPPRAEWRHTLVVRALRAILREGLLRPLWHTLFDQRTTGLRHLEGVRPPFLVAANHTSELDPGPVLFGLRTETSRRIAITAMWEHFLERRTGSLQYAIGVAGLDLVPLVQRGDWRPTLAIAGTIVDRGGCPLVFPEGERSRDGRLLPFRRGVAVMARDLRVPVVPCAIAGLLNVLPKGAGWPRGCWIGRAPVAIAFGAPRSAPEMAEDPDAWVGELRDAIDELLATARSSLSVG